LLVSLFISGVVCQLLPVAIVHGEPNTLSNADVQKKISPYVNATLVNAKTATPSIEFLQQFAAVLSYPDGGYYDGEALGAVFKKYSDNGGGLVMAMFSFDNRTANDAPRGGFYPNYFAILPQNTYLSSGPATLVALNPTHPILQNVKSFNGGSCAYRGGLWNPLAGQIAQWSDGTPLVGTLTPTRGRRVDLSFFPPSSDVVSCNWVSSTDGARLMANSLIWAAGGSTSCSTNTDCFSCATASCQWCLDTNTCSSPSTSCPDRIVNPSDCPINCSFSTCSTCTSQDGRCSWCLDNHSCILESNSNTCRGVINHKNFCPSAKNSFVLND